MKYTVDVVINKDRETVVKELQNRDALFEWMKGLKSIDLIAGELGQKDSEYTMVFTNEKGKEDKMKETITEMNPPKSITTVYEMKGVYNECINRFEEEQDVTRYLMDVDFKFSFPMNLFIWMFKPMFKKQTLSGMNDFKEYVESL